MCLTTVVYKTTRQILTINFLVVFIYDSLQVLTTASDRFEQFELSVELRVRRHDKLVVLFAQFFAHLLFSHPVFVLHFGHGRYVGVVLPSVQPGSVVRVPVNRTVRLNAHARSNIGIFH